MWVDRCGLAGFSCAGSHTGAQDWAGVGAASEEKLQSCTGEASPALCSAPSSCY